MAKGEREEEEEGEEGEEESATYRRRAAVTFSSLATEQNEASPLLLLSELTPQFLEFL